MGREGWRRGRETGGGSEVGDPRCKEGILETGVWREMLWGPRGLEDHNRVGVGGMTGYRVLPLRCHTVSRGWGPSFCPSLAAKKSALPPSLPPSLAPASLPWGRSCFPAKSKAFISSFQSWE